MRLKISKSRRNAFAQILIAVVSAVSVSSCSTGLWPFDGKSGEPVKGEDGSEGTADSGSLGTQGKSKSGKIAASVTDVELKQARMWNRLDELEDEVKMQRERIKLLEQGLLTGIAPEELKRQQQAPKKISIRMKGADNSGAVEGLKSKAKNSNPDEVALTPVLDLPEHLAADKSEESPANSPDSYRVRIQVAKDYYQASRFGMAVAELAQISKDFGQKAGNGEARYWLGRSYLGLKEYGTAKGELEGFIASHPQSEFVPNAKLELGRCLVGLNLRDRARKEFSKIAKEYEGQDSGDIAAAELRNLRGTL